MSGKRSLAVMEILVLAGSFLAPAPASAGRGLPKENAPFQLEDRYNRSRDPKERVLIAVKLTEVRLKELQNAFKKGSAALQKETAENYLADVDRLGKAANEAEDIGYFKKAEQRLRNQLRELENLKMAVSYQERPAVEEIQGRVAAVQERILYSIMQPRQEAANR